MNKDIVFAFDAEKINIRLKKMQDNLKDGFKKMSKLFTTPFRTSSFFLIGNNIQFYKYKNYNKHSINLSDHVNFDIFYTLLHILHLSKLKLHIGFTHYDFFSGSNQLNNQIRNVRTIPDFLDLVNYPLQDSNSKSNWNSNWDQTSKSSNKIINYLKNNTTKIHSQIITFAYKSIGQDLILSSPNFTKFNPPSNNNNYGLASIQDLIGINYDDIRFKCNLSRNGQLVGDEIADVVTGFNDRVALMVINVIHMKNDKNYFVVQNKEFVIEGYSLEIYYRGDINRINKMAVLLNKDYQNHFVRILKKDSSKFTPMDIINVIRTKTNNYQNNLSIFPDFHDTIKKITNNIINQ